MTPSSKEVVGFQIHLFQVYLSPSPVAMGWGFAERLLETKRATVGEIALKLI